MGTLGRSSTRVLAGCLLIIRVRIIYIELARYPSRASGPVQYVHSRKNGAPDSFSRKTFLFVHLFKIFL